MRWFSTSIHSPPCRTDRAVVGGGVKILRRAAVPIHRGELGVAGIDRRAAQAQQLRQHSFDRFARWRFHAQPQTRRVGIGAADAELLHLEAAVEFHDRVEDLLHDMRVDQVPFGFDNFAHRKRNRCGFGHKWGGPEAAMRNLRARYFLNRLSNAARASAGVRGALAAGPFELGAASRATVTREEKSSHSLCVSFGEIRTGIGFKH